uniref:Transmembrane protein 79 n=1 Tax=Oryctolagus cuniculus TaxID=9986 RepID=A0A5F9CCI9_RABIT
MTEPETLALLEVKRPEAPEKSPPQDLVPNGRQPEGGGGAESPEGGSLQVESSAGSASAREATEDGLDSTVSEAATLPWGTDPQPTAPFPDPPGWRDVESEPLEPELPVRPEGLPEDDANLLPAKAARAFVPIDLQCIERRPQEDLIVRCEAGEGERRSFLPPRLPHIEPPECKWAEAVVRPPSRSCGSCGSCGGREGLRAVASVGAALVLFPCLLYGAYAFLPFDAPRLPTLSSRLVYTLRCGVFATFPIVLGESGAPVTRKGAPGEWTSEGQGLLGLGEQVSAPRSAWSRQGLPHPHSVCLPPACFDPVCFLTPPRAPGVRAEPVVLFCPTALWRAPAGGGDPPEIRGPVGPALHPVLLQPGRALHLPAPGHPQAAPSAHRPLRRLSADLLADLRRGPLLPRLRLRPHLPAAAVHAGVEPLLHVRGGARAHAHRCREPPGLPGPRSLGLGPQAPPLGLSRPAPGPAQPCPALPCPALPGRGEPGLCAYVREGASLFLGTGLSC